MLSKLKKNKHMNKFKIEFEVIANIMLKKCKTAVQLVLKMAIDQEVLVLMQLQKIP